MSSIASFTRLAAIVLFTVSMSAVDSGAQSRGRSVRVQLSDSASAVVQIGPIDTSVVVHTPQGIFRLGADSSALASWARASAQLPSPTRGPDAPAVLSGSQLRATDESGNAMRLVRLSADSVSAYQLTVSNGAWDYGVRIAPEKIALFLAALSGHENPELKWHVVRAATDSLRGYSPPRAASGSRAPKYPPRAELRGQGGHVRAQFAVGLDGRVRPETLLIMRSTHPLFALAVRDAIPSMRFVPATRDGIPIDDIVVQQFEFRVP